MTADRDNVLPLDYLLQRADANKLTGREALDLDRRLQAEAQPEGVAMPSTTSVPQGQAPEAYVIHNLSSQCGACNAVHRWSEVYSLFHIKSQWGRTLVRHLTPTSALEWNIPITSHSPATRHTPFCSDCLTEAADFVATLRSPRSRPRQS